MLSLQDPVEEHKLCRKTHGTENFQARDGWELPGRILAAVRDDLG